ncbi:ARM repeat-containing protein [Fistulina hepatica ATCC 64428]|uniref:ARM repeat-containing protein n=1 Tax=Fistulina hepatica ATCC 64428 TaxID=1128425 RepID=A0A0D7A521_9AGAR|nr:ARM repeat-containing protein [Fistulina hepatica ATCC 64428]
MQSASSPHLTQRAPPPSGVTSSIWAPQPQPLDSTWPAPVDSFSNIASGMSPSIVDAHQPCTESSVTKTLTPASLAFAARNGQLFPQSTAAQKQVGAIGDGRKRDSPKFEDMHVEQLFRTLNLNSPDLYASQKAPPNLNFGASTTASHTNSPDFSPVSVSSALLTPTDLSPSRSTFLDGQIAKSQQAEDHKARYDSGPLFFEGPSPLSGIHHGATFQQYYGPLSTPYHQSPSATLSQAHGQYTPSLARLDGGREWSQSTQQQFGGLGLLAGQGGLVAHLVPSAHVPPSPTHSSTVSSSTHIPPSPHSVATEPINFLSLLHPSSSPPYSVFVSRIIKSSDQQASIFLQQKLKVADAAERAKIVDAICARGFEMMAHRFGNWAVQRCLEAASAPEERRKIVSCMRGRVVELAMNCYGCHVLQKALDCEEDIRLLIVAELLHGDPAQTLVNKHASHVWSKIMELSWTPPAPPIFAYVNKALKGQWAALACHETGSLVVQHAFENLEEETKDGIVDEILNAGPAVFAEVTKNQWGSYCIQHILEHGSEKHSKMTLDHLINGLLEFSTNEQGSKSVIKALKEGGKETLDRVVKRLCEPAQGARRAMIVDLALSVTGSQLIASILPTADKDQRALLYDCIRGHIVTLRGCKTGSKVIWLL